MSKDNNTPTSPKSSSSSSEDKPPPPRTTFDTMECQTKQDVDLRESNLKHSFGRQTPKRKELAKNPNDNGGSTRKQKTTKEDNDAGGATGEAEEEDPYKACSDVG